MRKIPSLFQRNYDGDRLVRDELVPGTEWVASGEGKATRKYDGTCCLYVVTFGKATLYKRHERKRGKAEPAGFVAAQEPDPVTGDVPGWVPVGDGPEDQWHREALENCQGHLFPWTYELIGPQVQGNPEHVRYHMLIPHSSWVLSDAPRDFAGVKHYLAEHDIEGIVWWREPNNPDCDKVKIKRRDFGLPWPRRE